MGLLVVPICILLFALNHSFSPILSPEDYSFDNKLVTQGLPNSVVFYYNATSSPTDSVYIQQSWDPGRRQLVSVNSHEHSSIYYYPGYYRAKLIVGTEIVKERDLVIPTDGWMAAVEQKPVPVYFKPDDFIQNGILQLPVSTLQQRNIPLQPKLPVVLYMNVPGETGLKNDNFIFNTRLKSDFSMGSAACQKVVIYIFCKNDFFTFPLSAKGCVGELAVNIPGKRTSSAEADLSAFGCDFSNWVDVRCEVRNMHVSVFVDGKEAFLSSFTNHPKEVIGIGYRFEGTGSVDYAKLSHLPGESVIEDNFNVIGR